MHAIFRNTLAVTLVALALQLAPGGISNAQYNDDPENTVPAPTIRPAATAVPAPTARPASTAVPAPTASPAPTAVLPQTPAAPVATVIAGAGDITAVVEQYRNLLGANNGGVPGSQGTGRREINWDGVPDDLAAPNFMPPDFFNAATAPRARGAAFSTPGDGVQVSANVENPAGALPRFGNINPTYVDTFSTFSAERLFSPIGSNVVDMTFLVPGSSTPALVRGFGAVYTDVDQEHTAFEYFDVNNSSLGRFAVPIADNGLSFLGVAFESPVVARVRIEYGSTALGPDDSTTADVSVMDDFIYGEPVAR